MNSSLIALGAMLILFGFMFYHVWFRGREFHELAIKDATEVLPDWWPFAKFNRRWMRTRSYLWIVRIGITVTFVLLLRLAAMVLLQALQPH